MAPPRTCKSTAFYRGEAGREKAEEELTKQKARAEARKEQQNQPFRFRVAVGSTTQFVILDDAPDFYRFEHNLKNPQTGYWDTYTGCVKEFDNCPVCEATNRESYYALFLSVLDLTPFETRDGTQHDFSRKLLCVKPAQQKKFIRAYNKAEKDGLTLRGAIFEVTRDGDKDSSIGNDIEYIEHMSEDELATYVRSWKDKDGKKQTEDCSEPYVYEDLFEEPDPEHLRALVGADPVPGSRAHERSALGTNTRRRAAARDQDDDPPPTRSRVRGGDDAGYERPSRTERMRPRAGREADDPQDDDPPPSRSSARPRRHEAEGDPDDNPPPSRSRRASHDDDDPPPPRGRTAARRPTEDADSEPPGRRSGNRRPSVEDDDPPPGRRLPIRGRR